MTFDSLLRRAKRGEQNAINELISMYKPLLVKNAMIDGEFDEDLYQELILAFLRCIEKFTI